MVRQIVRSLLVAMALSCGLASPVSHAQTHEEMALWDSVKDSKDAEDYKAYLDKYPDGVYAPIAKRRSAEYAAQAPSAPAPATAPAETKAEPAAPAGGSKRGAASTVTMTECEGTNNCATWTFLGSQGNGQWPSGETANLSADRFDADSVVIRRADSTGPSAGLTATYHGTRHGDRIGGEFTAAKPGAGPVTGNWYATINASDALQIPNVMHMCIRCENGQGGTLIWENGHYTVYPDVPGQTTTFAVESFTRQSVILHRTNSGRYPGTAVLTGQISPSGDSIVNGMQTSPNGSAHSFRAAWGAAIGSVPGTRGPEPTIVVRPVACYPWFFTIVCG